MLKQKINKLSDSVYIAGSVLVGSGLTVAVFSSGDTSSVVTLSCLFMGIATFGLWAGISTGQSAQKGINLDRMKFIRSVVDGDNQVHSKVTLKNDGLASAVITISGISLSINEFPYSVRSGEVALGGLDNENDEDAFNRSMAEAFDETLDALDIFGGIEKKIKDSLSSEIKRQLEANVPVA